MTHSPRHWWETHGHPAYPELRKAVTWMGFQIKVLQAVGVLGYLIWAATELLMLAGSLALVTALFFQFAFERDPKWLVLRRKATRLRQAGFCFFPAGASNNGLPSRTVIWVDDQPSDFQEPF